MKLEDMTVGQIHQICKSVPLGSCAKCRLNKGNCPFRTMPDKWDIEGEVQDES